jgi:hypothetical protein
MGWWVGTLFFVEVGEMLAAWDICDIVFVMSGLTRALKRMGHLRHRFCDEWADVNGYL